MGPTLSESGVSAEACKRTGLDERDILMLRACLLDGDDGRQAVERLLPHLGEPDRQDWISLKQIPLLHRNLGHLGLEDPWNGKMKGVRRLFWARTRKRLGVAENSIIRLNQAGIPVMVMKGAALVASGLVSVDIRPMDDVDVLVPEGRMGETLRVLMPHGWTARFPIEEEPIAHAIETDDYDGRCLTLKTALPDGDIELDIHQFMSHFDLRTGTDSGVWKRSSEGQLGRAQVRIPCLEDQLLLICTHAASQVKSDEETSPTLRWVTDAASLLRHGNDSIDWDLFVSEARRRHVTVMVYDALQLLSVLVDVRVPAAVMRDLWNGRRRLEAACTRSFRVPTYQRSLWQTMLAKLGGYCWRQPDMFDTSMPKLFVASLRYVAKTARRAARRDADAFR
ncbi:nucleotidyltransferase family protein [Ancylobacter terrae]|uniref:nucleotidyltransferase family protein n=1 Tax=Ancylobacter sp. sgz301288 TaxID=3342077 RepID=UPI00385DACAB